MSDKILVEGDEMNTDAITRRLEPRGYRVVASAGGPRGIAPALAEAPQAGRDGYETRPVDSRRMLAKRETRLGRGANS